MEPRQRLAAFIADYFHEHGLMNRDMEAADARGERRSSLFPRWEEHVRKLEQAHFLPGAAAHLASVFSSVAPHSPDAEEVLDIEREGAIARISTRNAQVSGRNHFEYELRLMGDDWRIANLNAYLYGRDEPFMTARERPRFENPPELPLREMAPDWRDYDGNRLFEAGRVVEGKNRSDTLQVKTVGRLHNRSGRLVAGDLGYGPDTLAPLGRRIPPGHYVVEVGVIFDRIAALRVNLSAALAVRWHPADMGEGGHVMSVDAGNVGVTDLESVMSVTTRHKDRCFEQYAEASRPQACMLSYVTADDTAIADSGTGDGQYPAFWGVDAEGRLAVLLFDFRVIPA